MVSKFGRFLGRPFRLKGGEVSVELLMLPFTLSSGGPRGAMQVRGSTRESCVMQVSSRRGEKQTKQSLLVNPFGMCYMRQETCVGEASEVDFRS